MARVNYAHEYAFKAERTEKKCESEVIHSSIDAFEFAKKFYDSDINLYESAFVILLNRGNRVIGWFKVSQGGLDATVIDKRLIAKVAIEALACGVILVHNHPSGNLRFSTQDNNQSTGLKNALKTLDITLCDSIIITEDSYLSAADEGIL